MSRRGERARPSLLALGAVAALGLSLVPAPSSAASPVAVLHGGSMQDSVFPDDALTVADPAQLTGRRVALPVPACDLSNYSICDGLGMINSLDGFDLQPRVRIPFSGPVDIATVNDGTVWIQGPDGAHHGIGQLVLDPATNSVAGISKDFLLEATTYTIVVTNGVHDAAGNRVEACGGACRTSFTTRTATAELDRIRRALDDGSAYSQAGIADRAASFVQGGVTDVFPAATITRIDRADQTSVDPKAAMPSSLVPDLSVTNRLGSYAFGSVEVPDYQVTLDNAAQNAPWEAGVIPPVPSTQTPRALGKQQIGFILIVPAGPAPAGGWPVAVYGPGFTRSKYDIFVSADFNSAQGFATLATDPQGHGFGPLSTTTVTQGPLTTSFLSYGQGRDLDGDGTIGDGLLDGVGPTDHKVYDSAHHLIRDDPSHQAADGLRSGLMQTVVNNMALVRMIEHGVNVPTLGTVLATSGVRYYGISFGGIYGAMLMGTDPHVQVGLMSVPGGPIADIARLSGFRGNLRDSLKVQHPNPLNGGPGLDGFTESIPLRNDPPETKPYPGAIAIQETLAYTNWYDRAGSPESFAPLIRLRPLPGSQPKTVLFQTADGDRTVPNPTAATLYRAGALFDRVTLYRNDLTPTYKTDPHGFLADPTIAGRYPAEVQMSTFLGSNGATVIDPDGPGPVFETPIADGNNIECLHYPEPQTGLSPNPQPGYGVCPAAPVQVLGQPGPTTGSGGNGVAAATGLANTAGADAPRAAVPVTTAGAILLAAVARRRRGRRPAPA